MHIKSHHFTVETRCCWSQIEQVHVHCNTHIQVMLHLNLSAKYGMEHLFILVHVPHFWLCPSSSPTKLFFERHFYVMLFYVLLAALFSTCLDGPCLDGPEEKLKDSFSYISYDRDRVHSFVEASGWGSTFKELRVSIVDACMLSPTLGLWMALGFQTKTWCHDGGRGLYWACAVRREARLDLRSRATTDR